MNWETRALQVVGARDVVAMRAEMIGVKGTKIVTVSSSKGIYEWWCNNCLIKRGTFVEVKEAIYWALLRRIEEEKGNG